MSAPPLSNELLYNVFAGTLSADKGTREAAEQALTELSVQHADLVLHLIRFACEAIHGGDGEVLLSNGPARTPAEAQQRNVLLAAAIRVRNVLGRSDWNRLPCFTETVKVEVRQVIVPLQCQAHVSEYVRRQLLDTTKELIAYDYPKEWPSLIPQLNSLMDGWVAALRSALRASGNNSSSEQVLSVVLQLKGGLGVLRACCKVYEDPLRADAKDVDRFSALFCPSLVSLSERLLALWRGELYRLERHYAQCELMDLPGLGNLFELTPTLTELSHCLRLVLKCLWSLLATRLPKCLCAVDAFNSFWRICIAEPLAVLHRSYLPLCHARLQVQMHTPGQADMGDHFTVFQESAVWKLLKWIYCFAHKLLQEYSRPNTCEKRARAVASVFRDEYAVPSTQYALELVRWHSVRSTAGDGSDDRYGPVLLLTSKAYIMALEIICTSRSCVGAYTSVVLPAAEELMTGLLFPRLAFSLEEEELWSFNPEEYVRRQSSPVGDLFSAKAVSVSCLLALAAPAPQQDAHGNELLVSLVNFLMNQLMMYSTAAAQAVSEQQSGPIALEAARRVDAALFCMVHFKKILAGMHFGDDKLEAVLTNFVVPATRYPLGFLRARAVLVLSVFAPSIEWSSPQAYQAALQAVLPLLRDADTPVRVQTCVSFSRLIRHPYAREVVTPCIVQLIQHYFDVMRLMDSEAVVRTLRKTISYYHDSLARWGVELAAMLVAHFHSVLRNVALKYSALEAGAGVTGSEPTMTDCLEDDGFADVLMAADELLDTLTTLVKALPDDATEDAQTNIFCRLQCCISPMLFAILSHQGGSTYGFMDPVLMLLTTLLSRSVRVVALTWRLMPCLHQLILHGGAVDYFGQMLAPLDNYASVATEQFLFFPLQVLCDADGDHAFTLPGDMATRTPMQLVQEMAGAALQGTGAALRGREIVAVPKLYDAILQNYWMLRSTSGADDATSSPPAATDAQGAAVVSTAAQQLLTYLATTERGARICSGNSIGRTTLRVIFINGLLSCVLADAAAALQALAAANALGAVFQQYVVAVMGTPLTAVASGNGAKGRGRGGRRHGGAAEDSVESRGVRQYLRPYDENLFVLAFCAAVRLLTRTEWTPTHEALLGTLCAVVDSSILETYAQDAKAAGDKEMHFLTARIEKLQRRVQKQQQQQQQAHEPADGSNQASGASAAAADAADDDDADWEDNSSTTADDDVEAAEDEDDVDGFDEEMTDDEDDAYNATAADGAFGSEGTANLTQDSRLQAMLRQAQQLRGGGRQAPDVEDEDAYEDVPDDAAGDDDDADENFLEEDEDEDFSSPVDAVNVWAVLVDEVLSVPPAHAPAATLVNSLVQHNAGDVFVQARDCVGQLLAARAALQEATAAAAATAA